MKISSGTQVILRALPQQLYRLSHGTTEERDLLRMLLRWAYMARYT
jgi:hypothetical protein